MRLLRIYGILKAQRKENLTNQEGTKMKEWFIRISPDGMFDYVCCDPERDSLLDFFYSQIECSTIECVRIRPDTLNREILMIVDEEGLLRYHKDNTIASLLYQKYGGCSSIVGTVLIGEPGIRNGEPDILGFTERSTSIITYAKILSDINPLKS